MVVDTKNKSSSGRMSRNDNHLSTNDDDQMETKMRISSGRMSRNDTMPMDDEQGDNKIASEVQEYIVPEHGFASVADYYEYMSKQSADRFVNCKNPKYIMENLIADKTLWNSNKNATNRFDKQGLHYEASYAVTFMILSNEYRTVLTDQRKLHSQKTAKNMKSGNFKARTEPSQKIEKKDTLPKYMLNMTQKGVKLAVCSFLISQDSIRRPLLLAINSDRDMQTVSKVLNICEKPIGEIKEYIATITKNDVSWQHKAIINALLVVSHLLKSASSSKLAYEICEDMYKKSIYDFICLGAKNPLTNKEVYEPIIALYIKSHIAPVAQQAERAVINSQIKTSLQGCLQKIFKAFEKVAEEAAASKVSVLDGDQQYDYYYASNNFARDIVTTYREVNDVRYQISLFHECLFDVHGSTYKEGKNVVQELFDHIPWSERLEKLPMATKINLHNADGQTILRDLPGGCDVMVSWMDKTTNLSYSKTIHLKKRPVKKSEDDNNNSTNLPPTPESSPAPTQMEED